MARIIVLAAELQCQRGTLEAVVRSLCLRLSRLAGSRVGCFSVITPEPALS